MPYVRINEDQLKKLGMTLDIGHCLSETERAIVSDLIEIDNEIELDDLVVASRGNDNGMYVMAWVWVAFPYCECGEPTYDLESTACADCKPKVVGETHSVTTRPDHETP